MLPAPLLDLARAAGAALATRGLTLATAESCTGGGLAFALTAIPGSSAWFERGFITYSNAAKCAQLGVLPETLAHHGAVSEETVREMTAGVLRASPADLAIAISGIAGPGGGTPDKPQGTVCLAWQRRGRDAVVCTRQLPGDRHAVRLASIEAALTGLLALCPPGGENDSELSFDFGREPAATAPPGPG